MDLRPDRMLLLAPGAPARIEFAVPAPAGMDPAKSYRLCTQLYVMNAAGTVVAVAPVAFDVNGQVAAGSPVTVTASIPESDATAAAVALAGRDGRWELVLCEHGNCPQPTTLESGPAHSTVDNRRRTRIPTGCRDCGGDVPTPPPFSTTTWTAQRPYRAGDVVEYQGRYYVATCAIPVGSGPPNTWPTKGKVKP